MKKSIIVSFVVALALVVVSSQVKAKEVTKSDGTKVSMCYTHAKKWHPCAIQASK